jgi:hypothetical protein
VEDESHVFVLKIWKEERDFPEAIPIRRGSIEDVQTRSRVYFGTLQELCSLLSERTGMRVPEPPIRLSRARRRPPTTPGDDHPA